MEQFCLDRGNFVALYAETLLSRVDFKKMFYYVTQHHEKLRKRYKCEKAFPEPYDKISRAARN